MTFDPTPEQQAIREAFATGESLAIEAGAGTGKTSTLVLLAEDADAAGRTGQYVAFNKAIVTDAGAKMPGNVVCSTAHSLAFRAVGRHYAHRLNGARMKSGEVARRLRVDPFTVTYGTDKRVLSASYLGSLAMRTVRTFCQSTATEPLAQHVPYVEGIDLPTDTGRRTYSNNDALRAHLMPAVRRAWADISDTAGSLRFEHDHYLKLWHLAGPRILADIVFFDEAQDANPVLVDIVRRQADHAQLVWVGDSQQQIYAFTGAVNAMADVPADRRLFLTQSFRFGQAVADVANGLLARLDADLRLRGFDRVASVVAPVPHPDAILCRTNAEAIRQVMFAIAAQKRPALVGGGSDLIAFCEAALDLQAGKWTGHPELSIFGDWAAVQEYVTHDEDGSDLRLMVRLIDEFGAAQIIAALRSATREADADVVVSTAHKSKGREWASVRIAGDFPPPKGDASDVSPDELRLAYVAVTRAKRELDVTAVPHFAATVATRPAPAPLVPVEVVEESALDITRRYS